MLGDLRERLAPVGQLEILDEVGAKVLAYFDSLPPDAQNDDELMRRARALSQIGEVRLAKGDADGAIVALSESLALASRGVERQPTRTDWLATLGATHFWIGYAHWNRNALDTALKEFTAYRTIAGRMVELEPARAEWQLELAQAESNLGSLHQVQGRFPEAERHFDAAVTIKRALAEAQPDNPRWQRELASSLSWVGEAVYRQGPRARRAGPLHGERRHSRQADGFPARQTRIPVVEDTQPVGKHRYELQWVPDAGQSGWVFADIKEPDQVTPLPNPPFSTPLISNSQITVTDDNKSDDDHGHFNTPSA